MGGQGQKRRAAWSRTSPGVPETDSRPLWRSTSSGGVLQAPQGVVPPGGVVKQPGQQVGENRAAFQPEGGLLLGGFAGVEHLEAQDVLPGMRVNRRRRGPW